MKLQRIRSGEFKLCIFLGGEDYKQKIGLVGCLGVFYKRGKAEIQCPKKSKIFQDYIMKRQSKHTQSHN